MKYIVLDTNILLLDSTNLYLLSNEGRHTIVIPDTVIQELDSKKTLMEEIGFHARKTSSMLSDTQLVEIIKTDTDVTIKVSYDKKGYSVPIELVSKHQYKEDKNDLKIIEVAEDYLNAGKDVIFISNDTNCRFLALTKGIPVDYVREQEDLKLNTMVELEVEPEVFSRLELMDAIELNPEHLPENYSYHVRSTDGNQALFLVHNGKLEYIDEDDIRKQEAPPKNREQMVYSAAILSGNYDYVVCDALAGSGKAQPLSEKVLTPSGWVSMGELQVGDYVIGSNGTPIKVLNVYPQGIRPIYRITFIDGTSVLCDEQHLWEVRCRSKGIYSSTITLSVSNMLESWIHKQTSDSRYPNSTQNIYNYSIPSSKACEFGNDDLIDIDPYLMGLLLGDGGFTRESISFTNGSLDLMLKAKELLEQIGYTIRYTYKQGAYHGNVSMDTATIPFTKLIEKYNLLGKYSYEKHIPNEYLMASLASRRRLYQGMIDTDGYVQKGKLVEYSTSSSRLAEDFLELGRSIGLVLSIKDRVPCYTYKGEKLEGKLSYRIRELVASTKYKSITGIEYSHEEEAQCILVDSTDHLYVTSGYNLTHNTHIALSSAMRLVRQKKYSTIYYLRNTVNNLEKNEELGFLPGTEADKAAPFFAPLYDSVRTMVMNHLRSKKLSAEMLEEAISEKSEELIKKHNIKPITTLGLRGRTLTDSIIIMDESQNFSPSSAQTALTRIGENCLVIIIGSSRQIDNTYLNKYTTGLAVLIGALKREHPEVKLSGIELTKVVRGRLTEFAERIFTKGTK